MRSDLNLLTLALVLGLCASQGAESTPERFLSSSDDSYRVVSSASSSVQGQAPVYIKYEDDDRYEYGSDDKYRRQSYSYATPAVASAVAPAAPAAPVAPAAVAAPAKPIVLIASPKPVAQPIVQPSLPNANWVQWYQERRNKGEYKGEYNEYSKPEYYNGSKDSKSEAYEYGRPGYKSEAYEYGKPGYKGYKSEAYEYGKQEYKDSKYYSPLKYGQGNVSWSVPRNVQMPVNSQAWYTVSNEYLKQQPVQQPVQQVQLVAQSQAQPVLQQKPAVAVINVGESKDGKN